MRISTIIPAYNCEPYLRRAVESLLATQYHDLEIVIVDDGSRDGTLGLAETLQREHPGVIRVLTHRGRRNCGVSATRNLGIQSSSGELIAFLDADDYVHPWRFQSAIELLETEPDVDGVHQLCELVFSDEESSSRWWPGQRLFGFAESVANDEILFSLLGGYCWATSAILFRRTLLSKSGMFDPRLKVCEDCHLWFRMACCGRIVSGDLSRPVSVYWRRTDSAYQPSPWGRVPMVRAMASFYRWMRCRNPLDARRPRVSRRITEYILTGVEEARGAGQSRLAWLLAGNGTVRFPPLRRQRRLYGNLVRMAIGR